MKKTLKMFEAEKKYENTKEIQKNPDTGYIET